MEFRYVRTNGKGSKAKERIDKEFYTREQVDGFKYMYGYGRVLPPGHVLVDVDYEPYIHILDNILKNSKLKYERTATTKGLHFVFKLNLAEYKDTTNKISWLGIKNDTKGIGTKQDKKIAYQAMKIDDIERQPELIHCRNFDDIDYAPWWIYAMEDSLKPEDLTTDEAQTGKRNSLFHHDLMWKAKKAGHSRAEYVELCEIINSYIFKEPLTEDEVLTATREDQWEGLDIKENKGKVNRDVMVTDLIDTFDVGLFNDLLFFYDPKTELFSSDPRTLKQHLQENYKYLDISMNKMDEVVDQLRLRLFNDPNRARERDPEYIICGDELVSMFKDEVKPRTRTVYTDIYYPYKLMSKTEMAGYKGRIVSFIKEISCHNKKVEQCIWESLGCMIAPKKPFQKMFIWYGDGNNGKSVLLHLMQELMGKLLTNGNILTINEKFGIELLPKGIANVTDDVGQTTIKETGLLKSLISGGTVEVTRKGLTSLEWRANTQLVICCNYIPHIMESGKAITRRLQFIPFNMVLKEDEIDYMLEDKLKSDPMTCRYLLTKAVEAYREAIAKNGLTTLDVQKDLLNDFMDENKSPLELYYFDLMDRYPDRITFYRSLHGKCMEDLYAEYKEFCKGSGFTPITSRLFHTQFCKLLPFYISKRRTTVGGRQFRVLDVNFDLLEEHAEIEKE